LGFNSVINILKVKERKSCIILTLFGIISTLCIGVFVIRYLLKLSRFKEVKEMMIASVVTHENVDATIEDVKELIDYTIEKAGELNENN
jgi:hypothetical protein